ncbi:ABC transporter ATP-binding protein [soil metagenome]
MISIEELAYAYNDQKKINFQDFTITQGQHWLLLGQSGSGKTTLLHLLGGLLKSQQGRIRVNDTDLSKLSETELDRFRAKNYGFIFQKNHLINALSVRDNLLMAPFLAGLKQDEHRVSQVLAQLDLSENGNSRIKELSHGQAQRVAIARAVLNKPAVILADEPTSALDDINCDRVIDLLLQASEQNNSTLIVATHDQRLKSRIKNQIQL